MKRTRITKIKTETREILIVRRAAVARLFFWCDDCQTRTEWLDPTETARLIGAPLGEITRLTESGAVHSIKAAGAPLLVCQNSLQSFLEQI